MTNIDSLTIGEAKQLAALFCKSDPTFPNPTFNPSSPSSPCPFEIGSSYYIRTVTFHFTGRIRSISGGFLVLDDAAWIAESGRYFDALSKGILNEVEPIPDGSIISLSSITDASPWNHPLPKVQK